MTFDPFGDFATEGYLRNFEKEKDLAIVKRAENASFVTGLDEAFAALAKVKVLSYDDVLQTHGILFGAVYFIVGILGGAVWLIGGRSLSLSALRQSAPPP